MATAQQLQVLQGYYWAACDSEHIFPAFAACEAVLESNWGTSELAKDYHNLFGQKTPVVDGKPNPPDGVLSVYLPTHEYIGPHPASAADMENPAYNPTIRAPFLWFTKDADAFTHRMKLLQGASSKYPEYAAALHATDGDDFVREVSRRWSTDPLRAEHVLEIYYAHKGLLQ